MAAFPAMPLFTDAYLADTRHLTTEEHGAYLLLLMCAWRSRRCALADEDKALARIAGLTPARWRRMRPTLEAFFVVSDGLWKQGKLTSVYDDVAKRVSRNRISGAKGGRALAAKKRSQAGKTDSKKQANAPAAKAKTKYTESAKLSVDTENDVDTQPPEAGLNKWLAAIQFVVGDIHMDIGVIRAWLLEDVDLEHTALPTITAVLQRELKRTGKAPKRLAYYRDAVLEAAKSRSPVKKTADVKIEFNLDNETHWRQLLGDPKSRFRGDYMARNWFIPGEHPHFLERGLGPNPRFSQKTSIPAAIYDEYARRWLWL